MMQDNWRWCYCTCSCCSCRSRDPEIPPLLMQRLPIAESRRFSNSSSHFLLLLLIFPSVSVSNLAIGVAVAFCKNLVALASTRPLDRSKKNDRHSSPRSPRHFRGSFQKHPCNFSGSISIFFAVIKKHVACANYLAIYCMYILWYYGRYKYLYCVVPNRQRMPATR